MNYLSHFFFNHTVCGIEPEPYFAMGVLLPDLWLRFSRKRRIRWKAVRAASPMDATGRALRAGLLNHVEMDRRFHGAPVFLRWQKELKGATNGDGVHPALFDFLAHATIELTMDHLLLRDDPTLVNQFYSVVSDCDPRVAAERVGDVGAVDTRGLDEVIRGFIERRFLRHYRTQAGLADAVRVVLSLANISALPDGVLAELFAEAVELVEPGRVWEALAPDSPPTC